MQYSEDLSFLYNFTSDQNKDKVLSAASNIEQKTGLETNTFKALDNVRYPIPYIQSTFVILCNFLFFIVIIFMYFFLWDLVFSVKKTHTKNIVCVSDKQLSYRKMVVVPGPLRCWWW